MKIKHIWSVLCKESIVNQDDNLISIHGVLEELKIDIQPSSDKDILPEKIAIPMNYEIVSLWVKEEKDVIAKAELEFVLFSPKGEELSKATQAMEIPVDVKRIRSRMKISGFPVMDSGDYYFEVKIKEEGENKFVIASKLPLEVKVNLIYPKTN